MIEKISFKIVPFYASLLTLYYLLLTYLAIIVRRKYLVPLGDGTLEFISGIEKQRSESSSADSSVTQMIIDKPFCKNTMNYEQFRHFQRNNRAHANFSENVPLALLLLFFIEVNNYISPLWLHGACGALLTGRMVHGIGFIYSSNHIAYNIWRILGVTLNLLVLTFAAIVNGYNFLIS